MIRSIKVLIVGLTMSGASSVAAVGAAAASEQQVNQIEIRYTDLNLQSEAGAAALLSRLSAAAKKVCNIPPPVASHTLPWKQRFVCREMAMQNAVADINHPAVTALYRNTRGNTTMKVAGR